MSDLIDSLRTVAEFAASAGNTKMHAVVARWCREESERASLHREKHIRIGKRLARGEFGLDFGSWTDDNFAEFGELCHREVDQQFASGGVAETTVNPDQILSSINGIPS